LDSLDPRPGEMPFMADITVRNLKFEFPEDLPVLADPNDVRSSCATAGLSFTLPYLEPYLIRTMSKAMKQVTDPVIAADMRKFSGQEGNHFRNHARLNNVLRRKLSPKVATEITQIEAEMEADYQRFSATKSLKFNLAYAEGFEAMTLAFALATLDVREHEADSHDPSWGSLMAWHLAEEVEHRTVTFDAYDHLYGQYFYRLAVGLWAQKHFVSYVIRFAKCIGKDFASASQATQEQGPQKTQYGSFLRLYLRTQIGRAHV
jgi:predicted metal-dependent hydrolase